MAAYKIVKKTYGVPDAVDEAISELEQLKDEVTTWRDGMQGTNLENSQKYTTLDEAASQLDNIQSIDNTEVADALSFEVGLQVPTQKNYNTSRAVRNSNAVALLSGAVDAIASHLETLDPDDENYNELEQLQQDIQDALDYADGVEYPGFYG